MSRNIGDHPDIAAALLTGYPLGYEPPACDEEEEKACPVCGELLRTDNCVYRNSLGEIVGCFHCLEPEYAGNVWEELG